MRKRVKKFINNFWTVIMKPEMLVLPGQLAFFFILSVVPILTLIGYGAQSLNISFDVITAFLSKSFGNDIVGLLMPNISKTSFSIGFIVTLLFGFIIASNGASSIIITSNTIYGIEDKGFIRRKIKSIIMTLFIVLLFLFILLVPLLGESITSFIKHINSNTALSNNIQNIINILNGPLSWFIIFFFIKLLYTMAPDKTIPSSQTTYGAIFTSVGWIISTAIYSFYITHYAYYSLFYGGLTNIIILMLWMYLLAFIFTIGLALNYRRDESSKIDEIKIPKTTSNKIK